MLYNQWKSFEIKRFNLKLWKDLVQLKEKYFIYRLNS